MSNNGSDDELKEAAIESGKKILFGLGKAKKKIGERLAEGVKEVQKMDDEPNDNIESLKKKGSVFGNFLVKAAVEGLSETITGLNEGGSVIKNAIEKNQKKKDKDSKNSSGYEIID